MAKPSREEVIDWAKKKNLDVDNFIDELDQYKTAHDKLTAGLKEAVAESIKYKRQRDSLIKDVKKLREEKAAIEMHLDAIKTYKPMYEKLSNKYTNLTEHIKDKALNNPSEHRYFRLVHFIDDLEDE
ncbi:hypothetical protein SSCS72_01090 [Mammaliicoccus sciuri]|uniref:hypothetical protein n=2 Tax=Mammaliicoccus TaxID=2803850 RepID=UPI001EF6DB3B|nr:hypothetical protein [Mammaliicoccus sciuri]CAG7913294.1 hypothetical protein SSCS72_01090 [Mammaliicoccus sciuri]